MKLRYMGAGLAALVVGLGFYFWKSSSDEAMQREIQWKLMMRSARGTADDPIARERWEFMRLRNPETGKIPEGIRAKELAYAATLPTKESFWRKGLAKAQAPFTWAKRGPYNVGGRTRGFAADSRNANILLAGGISGGMWRSTDDGATWTKTTAPTALHNVTCLVQDPRAGQQDTWYAGSGERSGNSASGGGALFLGGGIYKSTDNGISWSQLDPAVSTSPQTYNNAFEFVNRVAVDESDGELYAAVSNVIEKSTNSGLSWAIVRGGLQNNTASDVQVTTTGVVYAAINSGVTTDVGIWRSPDGVTWTNILPAGFPTAYGRIFIAIAPSNQSAVYFLVQGTNGTDGVNQINSHQIWKYTYISGNGSGSGGTWVNKGVSLPNEAGAPGNAVFDTQGGYDMFVTVKPDAENFVIIGGVNLYKTADFSATTPTWTRIGGYATAADYSGYANHHADQHSGFFRPGSNLIYYSGHDGGLSKTSDVVSGPVSWGYMNNGYSTSQFYTLAVDRSRTNNIIIGGLQDNGSWWTNNSNSSTPWVQVLGGDGSHCAIGNLGAYYYMSSQSGNTYRFTLNETTGAYTTFTNVTPTGATGFLFINPFALDRNNSNIMYMAAGDRLWRNSDLSAIASGSNSTTSTNWTELTNTATTVNPITALGVSTTPSNRVYFANNNGDTYRLDGANSGNPTPVDVTGTLFPFGYTSCIAVNPNNGNQVMVVFSNYVSRSLFWTADSGTTWTDVGGNLEQFSDGTGNGPSCRWAAVVPTSQGTTYFVATSVGLYSTTLLNGASTVWTQEGSTTIGNVVTDMIDYRTSDGLVAVATHGNGVYSTNVIVSNPTVLPTVPTSFALTQNFPNPFNPSTTIQYDLPERTAVKLSVFDMAGREIAVLVNTELDPGRHEARWNARDSRGTAMASGTYFYRLTAVGKDNSVKFSRTEKMSYVK